MKYRPSKYFTFLNKKTVQIFDIKSNSINVKFKKYKCKLWLLFLIITSINLNSQNILISTGGTVSVNGGEVFLDAGGPAGNDGNANRLITFCSSVSGKNVCLDFTMFNTYYSAGALSYAYGDSLCLFNGATISNPKMATLSGNYTNAWNSGTNPTPVGIGTSSGLAAVNSPGIFCSTNSNGCITASFYNIDATQSPGWSANISLYEPLGVPGCSVNLAATSNTVCSGTTVTLTAIGNMVSSSLNNNFNSSTVGTGWQTTSAATFSNNACGNPSLDGSTYLWMSNSACPRTLRSNGLNVSNGGIVSYEYRSPDNNSDPSPCEAPDINGSGSTPEAVFLQYSINSGTTWSNMKVMFPNNIQSPSMTGDNYLGCGYEVKKWSKIVVPIPTAAQTTNTQFRWIMPKCTSAGTDNWGLDNVNISTIKTKTISIKDITNNAVLISSTISPISFSVNPTSTTVYQASITDGTTTCTSNQTITVGSGISPTTTFSYSNPYCSNGTNPIPSLSSGFTAGGTFFSGSSGLNINATSGTVNLASSSTGTYIVTYTVAASSCGTSIGTSTIIINPRPTLTVNSTTICSGTNTILTVSGANSYLWSTGATTNTINVNPSINSVFTSTGTLAGCSTIISASVSISPLPVISANNSTICLGSSTILSATGATTYTWSNSVINGIAFSPSVTSTYTVNGTNMFGCVNSTTSNVTVNPNPTITIPIGAICPGGSFTLTPIGATSYTYSSGTQLVSPITTTSYTVTGSNASGCTNTAVCTISVNPNPTVTVPSGTICQGSSFTITPIGATSYTYSSGNPVVSPITTASYTVIGSNASGCTNTAVCMVSVNPNPIVTVPSGTICQGSSFTMTPTGTTSYAYSSGTAIVSPITTTSYTVTGSNASGCTNTAVCTVSVNPNPTVTVPSGTICQGSSFTMNPTGATSYTYSSGTAIVSPAITTNYIVTGNDALGCTNTTVCTVSVVPTPFVSVNSPTICSGQTATLTASGASTYSWSTGSLLNPILVSPTASTIYNVTGTSLGCSTTTVLTVIANPLPVMSVNNSTICIGQTTTLTASGANSYLWNTGSTSNPINISPLVSTTYTVVGSTLGCTQLAISTVIVNPLPILNANSASMCSGQSSLLSATGANTYTWSPGTNLNTTTGSFVSANPSTSTTYSILGTDANGCVNNTTASLFVLATPSLIAVANPSVVCAGNSINLTASGALNYTWTPGSVFINSLTITPASSSVYSVLGENVSGSLSCSSTQSVLVNVIAPIVINTSNTDSICLGGSKVIFAAGGITYSWLPTVGVTNPNAASTVVKPIVTTEYTVTVSNGSLCSKTGTVKIVVNPLPIVYAGRDTTINSDEAYVLQGSSNVTNFGFLNPAGSVLNCNFCSTVEVAPKVTTCYILKGENNHQCVAYDEVCINVTNDYGLYIPNAFTPNGDQDNELFIPIGYGIKSIKLSIFDRWGMEIFKSHDNAIGWDGKYKEKTCEQGIYAFSVLVITNEGRKISKTGHLTLLSNNK